MTNCKTALIIAPPGRLRISLFVLIHACQKIEEIQQVETITAGWQIMDEKQQDLVFLDTQFQGEGIWSLLAHIQEEHPQTHCCVFAQSSTQRQRAQAAGADASLLFGFSATDFFNVIEAFSQSDNNHHVLHKITQS